MSTRNRLAVAFAGCVLAASAQAPQNPGLARAPAWKIDFPPDSPVVLVSAEWNDSRTEPRGGAMVLDIDSVLSLRNASQRRIRGLTLLVLSQEVTAGGKASVSAQSLDVRPGETFPMHIQLRLLRPLLPSAGPLAQVSLDGVLFDDLSFYGPNNLNSRRTMTVWELEARRDRQYLKSVLASEGSEGLRKEMQQALARLADSPRLEVQVARGRRTTAVAQERPVQFAFLQIPDSPLEPLSGSAIIAANEALAPHISVRNRSRRAVRYFEIGWIIRDQQGKQFLAGSVHAPETGLRLAPGAVSEVSEKARLQFSSAPGRPVSIGGMTGFVSQVEFSDGAIWIPNRAAVNELGDALVPSPEEQRLADLYRKKGLAALLNELNRF
jgi:hypothetical protein